MKKILVTGAGGFIGSHLAELLLTEGYDVTLFLRYNSKNNWGWIENSIHRDNFQIVTGDIRDYDSVFSALQGKDSVFHLAALIGIPYSYVSPLAYLRTNIEGTYNVLEASRHHELDNIIVTSTSETYGSAKKVPIDEEHPLTGQSPYSASKIGADQLAISYFRSFGLPVKLVRPFNTYGPRQSLRAIIPTVITQLLSGKREIRVGSTFPTRDLTYVYDTARGFHEIAKSPNLFGEVTNIGMNTEISVAKLIDKIAGILKVDYDILEDSERIRPAESEVDRLVCDNTKLLNNTSWRPTYDIDKGLIASIEWFKQNISYFKTEIYNV